MKRSEKKQGAAGRRQVQKVEELVKAVCLLAAHKIHAEAMLAEESRALCRIVADLCGGHDPVVRVEGNRLIIECELGGPG